MTKVAQIGVGYWGPNLLRNLVASPRCDLTTVVELSQQRRAFVNKTYPGVEVVDDAEAVLGGDAVDAVVISTPAGTHYDLAMRALEGGKHVFVEKPMATTVEEVEAIGAKAKEKGLVAMVGHTFLFNPAVRFVKDLIEKGELGEVRYIYAQRLNLGRIRSDVDAWWNLAPHDVSIVQYLLGDPEPQKVTRVGSAYIQEGIDDVVFVTVEYAKKVLANIHVSWLDPHKVRCLTVVGSEKMVVYDDTADNKVAIYDKGIDRMAELGEGMDFDTAAPVFQHRSGDIVYPLVPWREPLALEMDHYLECIETGADPITGPAHAARVVEILSRAGGATGA